MNLPINKIKPDPSQPRKTLNDLDGLAKTIKSEGILQPLLVDKKYQIIDGERRWRAAKKAGLKEVPVMVLDDKGKRLTLQCINDVQHKDFPILERDRAWLRLYKKLGQPTKQAFADILGVHVNAVKDGLERATFIPKRHHGIKDPSGRIVRDTRGLPDSVRRKAIKKMTEGGITTDEQIQEYVGRLKNASPEEQKELIKEPITDYTKRADRVIASIKVVLKELNLDLMTKIPAIQAGILSGYIVELQKHLKTWEAQDAEVIE